MIIKTYTPIRRQAMPISKVGQRRQIVIPKEISDELGLHEGDFVEVTRDKSVVIITPKKLVDADEGLTSAQRATILTRAWLKAWKMSRADGSIGRAIASADSGASGVS
jgi:AbrB family looped-hinge helix DNA binding protein